MQHHARSYFAHLYRSKRFRLLCFITFIICALSLRRESRGTDATIQLKTDMSFAGSEYGGWWFNKAILPPQPIVYSFGLGEDTSWDEAMLDAGAEVYGFDPTPRSAEYVRNRAELKTKHGRFYYTQEGLSVEGGIIEFSLPTNPSHVSLRAGKFAGSGGVIKLKVGTLDTFMSAHGHKHIDSLKIEIEGSEYNVLENIIDRQFYPFTQLLVEFHKTYEGVDEKRHRRLLQRLFRAGFVITKATASDEITFQRLL